MKDRKDALKSHYAVFSARDDTGFHAFRPLVHRFTQPAVAGEWAGVREARAGCGDRHGRRARTGCCNRPCARNRRLFGGRDGCRQGGGRGARRRDRRQGSRALPRCSRPTVDRGGPLRGRRAAGGDLRAREQRGYQPCRAIRGIRRGCLERRCRDQPHRRVSLLSGLSARGCWQPGAARSSTSRRCTRGSRALAGRPIAPRRPGLSGSRARWRSSGPREVFG